MRTKRALWKEGGRDVWYGTSSIRKGVRVIVSEKITGDGDEVGMS